MEKYIKLIVFKYDTLYISFINTLSYNHNTKGHAHIFVLYQ